MSGRDLFHTTDLAPLYGTLAERAADSGVVGRCDPRNARRAMIREFHRAEAPALPTRHGHA
ncbi:hypothetical protein AB0N05_22485 [Nocardia sp. NPDC051030]|uniref:hypothetical protein n=1 Tax=Nocardia sp. NPDC051030 TaxID=3155162 RepID=UPI00344A4312